MKILILITILGTLSACYSPQPRSLQEINEESARLERMYQQRQLEKAVERAIRKYQR